MAWIKTIAPEEASGRLKEVYSGIASNFPMVPNIMRAFSLKPEVLNAVHRTFAAATFGASNLSRIQEEMIATVVSSLNRCHY